MPKVNAIVVLVDQVSGAGTGLVPLQPGVRFRNAAPAYFETEAATLMNAQMRILRTLQRLQRPAYLELDDNRSIRGVYIPIVGRVRRTLLLNESTYEVELDSCESRFRIDAKKDPDNFAFLSRHVGVDAFVVIAEAVDNWIFDAHPLPATIPLTLPPFKKVTTDSTIIKTTSVLSDSKAADDLFAEMLAVTCKLPTPAADCIPFLYANRGCWARAHRMCQMMAKHAPAILAGKAWLFGNLFFATANSSACEVNWFWHTAPIVRILSKGKPVVRVIDPSTFDRPATLTTWRNAMNAPGAKLSYSAADVYMLEASGMGRAEGGGVAAEPFECDQDLGIYSLKLQEIAPGKTSPPPFAHC